MDPDYLMYIHNINFKQLHESFEIVREFLSAQDVKLVGGLSIDIALKLTGNDGIYGDNTVPDYDCVCTDPVQIGYKLGSLLCSRGIDDVSVIPAYHMQTVRVRVRFYPVADLTYVPLHIYKKIRVLRGKDGLSIRHPDYQRIDMHHSLSKLYEKTPTETILHRAKKDATRYDLIATAYPINSEDSAKPPKMSTIKIPFRGIRDNACLSGFAAYALINTIFSRYFPNDTVAIRAKFSANDIQVSYETPEIYQITDLLTYDIDSLKQYLSVTTKYTCEPLIGILHASEICSTKVPGNTYRIYDTSRDMISAIQNKISTHGLYLCSTQYALLFFLAHYLYGDTEHNSVPSDIALLYYKSIEYMIQTMHSLSKKDGKNRDTTVFADDIALFTIPLSYFGYQSISETSQHFHETYNARKQGQRDDRMVWMHYPDKDGSCALSIPYNYDNKYFKTGWRTNKI